MMTYEEIDPILETGYKGPHIGGAFQLEGYSMITTNYFDGYILDISTTQYCGRGVIFMYVYYSDGEQDLTALCGADWHYNETWTPKTRFSRQDNPVSVYCIHCKYSLHTL